MQFPSNFNFKPANILKIAGLALVAIILISFFFRLIGSSFNSLFSKNSFNTAVRQDGALYGGVAYPEVEMAYDKSSAGVGLSVRNVAPSTVPTNNITTGVDAEEFEVTEYSATVETRRLDDACNKISSLKVREDVIFESADMYRKGCNYSFKVKHEKVSEILKIVESLDPKELNENTFTIKRQIDDFTSEVEILQKKMTSIEETLANAVRAYDDITRLATRTEDVESLAKIIDSKIGIIERLTQERINVNAQLERLSRAKAEQLDRLEFTYFNVNIFESKFIDGQNLLDSWKNALKTFVTDVNEIVQDLTVNLVALLLFAFQYIIYFFIILMIVKYGWKLVKYIWMK